MSRINAKLTLIVSLLCVAGCALPLSGQNFIDLVPPRLALESQGTSDQETGAIPPPPTSATIDEEISRPNRTVHSRSAMSPRQRQSWMRPADADRDFWNGSATLHLTVPHDAVIWIEDELTGRRTRTRHGNWNRYRHIRVNGLETLQERPVTVRVVQIDYNRPCRCNDQDCNVGALECCKRVELLAGDDIYMTFGESDFKERCAHRCRPCSASGSDAAGADIEEDPGETANGQEDSGEANSADD